MYVLNFPWNGLRTQLIFLFQGRSGEKGQKGESGSPGFDVYSAVKVLPFILIINFHCVFYIYSSVDK